MKHITLIFCMLCALNLTIYTTNDGECVRIETNYNDYPCTEEVKLDTGCWDEEGKTQLCGAKWVEVEP